MFISVIIPLYNKELYIQRSIRSVLAQTDQHLEIIIVNDGSTDSSLYQAKKIPDKRIHFVTQDNLGVSSARNRGVQTAIYDWVAFLDADDEWTPNFLEEIVNLHSKFPDCGLLALSYAKLYSENDEVKNRINGFPDGWSGEIKDYFKYLPRFPFSSSSVVINKDILKKVEGFPVGVTVGEDIITWTKLFLTTRFAFKNSIGAIYHKDAINRSLLKQSKKGITSSHIEFIKDLVEKKEIPKQFVSSAYNAIAKNELKNINKVLDTEKGRYVFRRIWSIRKADAYRKKWIKTLLRSLMNFVFIL